MEPRRLSGWGAALQFNPSRDLAQCSNSNLERLDYKMTTDLTTLEGQLRRRDYTRAPEYEPEIVEDCPEESCSPPIRATDQKGASGDGDQGAALEQGGPSGKTHSKVCKICKRRFSSKRKDAQFCSSKCRTRKHRARKTPYESHFTKRAICDEVRDQSFRPYENQEQARSYFEGLPLADNQQADLSKMLNWMDLVGGIIELRPNPYDQLSPELRPNLPMPGWKKVFYYGPRPKWVEGRYYHPATGELLCNPETEEPLTKNQIITPDRFRHFKKYKAEESVRHPNDIYIHVEPQKYRFLAAPLIPDSFEHTHEQMLEKNDKDHGGKFLRHLLGWHDEKHSNGRIPKADESHKHFHSVKGESDADRWSLDPLALEYRDNDRAFVVMEGPLKGASVLSQAEFVLYCPSVTLGTREELERLATEHLIGKKVWIVVDSDAFTDRPMVRHFALRTWWVLFDMNIDAEIVFPPSKKGKKEGVDDWLGGGGTLDQLLVYKPIVPDLGLIYDYLLSEFPDKPFILYRKATMVARLATFADEERHITLSEEAGLSSARTTAAMLGCGQGRVLENLNWFIDRDLLDLYSEDGTLKILKKWQWAGDDRGYIQTEGWDKRPVITIPEWCAATTVKSTIGDEEALTRDREALMRERNEVYAIAGFPEGVPKLPFETFIEWYGWDYPDKVISAATGVPDRTIRYRRANLPKAEQMNGDDVNVQLQEQTLRLEELKAEGRRQYAEIIERLDLLIELHGGNPVATAERITAESAPAYVTKEDLAA
jgi:hypothetical protein